MNEKIKVIYIAGDGRSGSTLLGRMLSEAPNMLMCGEIVALWTRGWDSGNVQEFCACGAELESCPHWGPVLAEAGLDEKTLIDQHKLAMPLFRRSRIAAIKEILLPSKGIPPLKELEKKYVDLYRAIAKRNESKVIVDTSKTPAFAFALARQKEIDLRIIHLIRDSRGVAYSWTKKLSRTDLGKRKTFLRQANPLLTSLQWSLTQLLLPPLLKRDNSILEINYEDVVKNPIREINNILNFSGEPTLPDNPDFLKDGCVRLNDHHSLLGNPNRTLNGWITLREDDAWRSKLSSAQKAGVTILSWPFLLKHGYPLSPF